MLENCVLIKKIQLNEKLFDFTVRSVGISSSLLPGQFLHIKCSDYHTLRRPISVCDVTGDEIRFVFEVRGGGTRELSMKNIGDEIDILGPLGNSFTVTDTNKKTLFVGGGIGIFPLLYHAKKYGENAIVLLGFRNKDAVCLIDDFKKTGCNVLVSTDDGSYGLGGFVTDLLKQNISEASAVFACGPEIMIKKTAALANEKGVFCEVSTEERMGCGIGACLVCACKIKRDGQEKFLHVCKDGPIFNSLEIGI